MLNINTSVTVGDRQCLFCLVLREFKICQPANIDKQPEYDYSTFAIIFCWIICVQRYLTVFGWEWKAKT